ncbi:uncharacterized protein LOC124133036 [Haliotis rufescens]|uniref:uncharacterized protein LOC124133036 n=1 Tax=Haliotis rufescens TaxID=6454 RepID=UPI00201EE61A|nr:uncharacterized protein LOC124133036 [Haliotis rufescens]
MSFSTSKMSLCVAVIVNMLCLVTGQYKVTIFPDFVLKGGRKMFDPDRWNSKMGLDNSDIIQYVEKTGARAGRWNKGDIGAFEKAPEDPHRKGYANPTYFRNTNFQQNIAAKYSANRDGYGRTPGKGIMMDLRADAWPHWMDTSQHKGHFPNNVDAAADMAAMLLKAVHDGSKGDTPPYFEPVNEVDSMWKYNVNWTQITDYHKSVNAKVKATLPHVKVGGPAYSGGISGVDKHDFKVWENLKEFLDMAVKHLDFISFHPFCNLHIAGESHYFEGPNEARFVGLIDLIESYAHSKIGKEIPIIISAYGLASTSGVNMQKPNPLIDYGYVYLHNAEMFTMLNHRGVVDRAVAFLVGHQESLGQASIDYSLLDHNNHERTTADAFHFWQVLSNRMTYLRTDSQFHGAERLVASHALVDPTSKRVVLLLHNFDTHPTQVKVQFDHGWMNPSTAVMSCVHLNSQKVTVRDKESSVHLNNGVVTLPTEASCYLKFQSAFNFAHSKTITETVHYGQDVAKPIHTNVVTTNINLGHVSNIQYAYLRVCISLSDKTGNPKPTSVQLNGNSLNSFYFLHRQNNGNHDTIWMTMQYLVPASFLKQNQNEAKFHFAQSGGRMSSVAVVAGTL